MPRNACHQFAATGTCSYGTRCKFSHSTSTHARTYNTSIAPTSLDDFFDDYSGFTYNPSRPAWDEFHRLARYLRWGKEEKADKRAAFKDALVQGFNAIYGTDENDLEAWQTLCRVLNIAPVPDELVACREAVKGTYVNLVDLVDLPNSSSALILFGSEEELSEYTLENGKFFPKENAYAGGLLKHLLRHIMNPEVNPSRPRRRRRNFNR